MGMQELVENFLKQVWLLKIPKTLNNTIQLTHLKMKLKQMKQKLNKLKKIELNILKKNQKEKKKRRPMHPN